MAVTTLLDIAKANGSDALVGLIEEVVKPHPEVMLLPMRGIKGLNYRTLVRTALPTVGFRSANEGVTPTKSTFENRLIEAFILNPRWECDKAVADCYEDGAAAYIAIEANGIMQASMNWIASQFYYGVSNDAKGFPGILSAVDSTMVVDAGGTTDNVSTSVWAVRFGPQACQWVLGNGGELRLDDVMTARVTDGSGNPYTAYVQELLMRIGLQVGSTYSVARMKKVTTDSGKGVTDAKISELLSKFPVGYRPDALLMSRRSLMQLQQSRTATTPTGAPAPVPTESFGVPIFPTDAILDTETLAS